MSKQTYEDIAKETAKQGIKGMEGARIKDFSFYPNTNHYNCSIHIDSHIVKGENRNYHSFNLYGHRLERLMDLMADLGFSLGLIRQFDRVDREDDDVLDRGITISFTQ